MATITYDTFLGTLYNGYIAKYHWLLDRKETLEKARDCRGDGKARSVTVEAFKIILEDFIADYDGSIFIVEASLSTLQRIIADGAPVAVDIFLRKYFELFAEMCESDDPGKDFVLAGEIEEVESKLATLGYPIFDGFDALLVAMDKMDSDAEEDEGNTKE